VRKLVAVLLGAALLPAAFGREPLQHATPSTGSGQALSEAKGLSFGECRAAQGSRASMHPKISRRDVAWIRIVTQTLKMAKTRLPESATSAATETSGVSP